ncbi:G-protein coupled receptor 151 [Pristis pectinata]|uniref:G-protein coupled receptor 151 n=1 Tax=Pristis pectinata TaxID=685728 RepID=UPI00223D1E92|nr:G-protein coupled receptor 151 [Pristis pectinata]
MEKLPVEMNDFNAPNTTNDVTQLDGGYQNTETKQLNIVTPLIFAAICLVGFAGNFLVIAVLITNARKGRTSMINSLILNLSAADLLMMLFCVPFRAVAYSRPFWTLGWFICKTVDWFFQSCLTAKSFTLAVLAKACFMYVSHPSKQVQIKHQRVAVVIISIWAMAFILAVPHWLFAAISREAEVTMCILDWPEHASNFLAVFAKLYPALVYCLPVTCTFTYHWKAFRRCKRRGAKNQNLRNQIRGRRLTAMLFGVSLAFAAMCAPEWVVWLWIRHVQKDDPSPPAAFILFSQVLVFSISPVNPFIFVSMSEEFKEGFMSLWKRLISSKPRTSPSLSGSQPQETRSQSVPTNRHQCQEEKAVQVPDSDPAQEKAESPTSKTANIVLSDMEQFWHDRQNAVATVEEDPVPWEHQSGSDPPLPERGRKM